MKKITKTKKVQKIEKPEKRVVRIIKLPNQGEPGYTPQKGVDYDDGKTPTQEELLSLITPLIPKVQNGKTPIKGIDYDDGKGGATPTEEQLLNLIKPLIPTPKPGKDGLNGKPYPTEKVKKMVDSTIEKKIPKLIEEVAARGNMKVEDAKDGMNLIIDGKKHFLPTYAPKLRNFIQMGDTPGTYRGGAGKVLAVNSTETGIEYIENGNGSVESVTGLNTDNTDPANPIIQISVDGITVTGAGTPGSPLVAVGDGTGDVHGPASAVDNNFASFDLTTGKIIQDSGFAATDFATDSQGVLADSALQPADIGVSVQAHSSVLDNTTASFTTADETKLDGIEAGADVTDTANVTSAGALMDSEVTSLSGIKSLTVPDNTTITAAAATVLDDTTVGAMVDTLGGATSTGTGGLVRRTSPDFTTGATIGSVAIPTISSTNTLTNKRITKRVVTAADATSITPNSDNADITYQANTQALGTLTINADGGTPTNGQSWLLKIKSTNVQTFSWNGVFVGGTTALPTATSGGGNIDYYSFIYDTVDSVWHFTGSALNF